MTKTGAEGGAGATDGVGAVPGVVEQAPVSNVATTAMLLAALDMFLINERYFLPDWPALRRTLMRPVARDNR
ncbi:MAG: hypothetical protein AAF936_10755 [Pseudomonadota bacterium]